MQPITKLYLVMHASLTWPDRLFRQESYRLQYKYHNYAMGIQSSIPVSLSYYGIVSSLQSAHNLHLISTCVNWFCVWPHEMIVLKPSNFCTIISACSHRALYTTAKTGNVSARRLISTPEPSSLETI